MTFLARAAHDLARFEPRRFEGRVAGVNGLLIELTGPAEALSLGAVARVAGPEGEAPCEIVGFSGGRALALPLQDVAAVRPGARVRLEGAAAGLRVSSGWLGRVVDALGAPVDGQGPLPPGPMARPIRSPAPPAHARARVGERLDLGVRAINLFAACCRGQRLGLFAGSGVGKSVLLSMLARNAAADVIVIGLIGERGREVREFIEDTLGPEGLKRAVVVVATSDEPAAKRRLAAHTAATIAEAFRDAGKDVLLLLDSVTRFAMAGREIGLAAGEPPAAKGYTPSVFAELPKLLERAGPGLVGRPGSITGLFTVLVEGEDHDEPIADAVRGILDGHIVLERRIAERGRYPAINVLRSLSRMMPACHTPEENALIAQARRLMSTCADMEELVRIGAYRTGADPEIDTAVRLRPALEAVLNQTREERAGFTESFTTLAEALQS